MEISEKINGIELVKRIDLLSKKEGITRKELCIRIGIVPSTIAACKTRNIIPTIDKIILISRYFNVSLDYLITGEEFYNDKNKQLKNKIIFEIEKFKNRIENL